MNNQVTKSINLKTCIVKTNPKVLLISHSLSILFNSCYAASYQKMKLSISCFTSQVSPGVFEWTLIYK